MATQAELNAQATAGRAGKRHKRAIKAAHPEQQQAVPVTSATARDKQVALATDASVRVIDRHGIKRMITTDTLFTRELLNTQPAVLEQHGPNRLVIFILDDRVTPDDLAFLLTQEFKFAAQV